MSHTCSVYSEEVVLELQAENKKLKEEKLELRKRCAGINIVSRLFAAEEGFTVKILNKQTFRIAGETLVDPHVSRVFIGNIIGKPLMA